MKPRWYSMAIFNMNKGIRCLLNTIEHLRIYFTATGSKRAAAIEPKFRSTSEINAFGQVKSLVSFTQQGQYLTRRITQRE